MVQGALENNETIGTTLHVLRKAHLGQESFEWS